ncbi:MAG: hypothetical protein HOQ22_16380 [Nocardioidaceae bacterium]|nr:hypothetical protein [Nocardioidaceae bacterium]
MTGITAPALAAPPEQWEDTPSVAPFHALLILFLLPAGLFLVITLLVYLPSMRHSEGYQPGQVWRGEPEWFGGPRKGVEAIDETEPAAVGSGRDGGESGRGGASGHW